MQERLMGATMAVIMLGFMLSMYCDTKLAAAIIEAPRRLITRWTG